MSDLYQNYSQINKGIHKSFDKDFYDHTAYQYGKLYHGYLPVELNANILDIGCGNGQFLYFLIKSGYTNFYGIDMDEYSLSIVKENISSKVEKVNANEFLVNKTEKYDFIIMNEVLEHVPKEEIIPLLILIYIALKTGGTLICYVPNMEDPFTVFTRYHDFTHTIGFTQNSLYMVLSAAGFQNISILPATYNVKGVKRRIKNILQKIIKELIVRLFEYPRSGYFSYMRIFSVARK